MITPKERGEECARDVEARLCEIWCRVLEIDQVGPHDDFFRLGGDSLSAIDILAEVEKTFGRNLPLITFLKAPTVTRLARAIRRPVRVGVESALVEMQPSGDCPPLFCVHGVGGEVLSFVDLARHLAPDQPFIGIRADSAVGADRPPAVIAEIASRYVDEVHDAQPYGPYYLAGFSFGGSVALEMAQQLVAAGERVAFLGIIDHTPPPLRFRRAAWTPARLAEFVPNTFRWAVEELWHPGRGQRLASVRSLLRRVKMQFGADRTRAAGSGRTDAEEALAGARVPESFRQLMERHYAALREYQPVPYPGHVTLFRARARPLFRLYGWDLGWQALAGGRLDVVPIPGNHASLLKEPHVRTLAGALKERIRAAVDASRRAEADEPSGAPLRVAQPQIG
jgi:thioesterase domain-containing protein/acyl carrier protein